MPKSTNDSDEKKVTKRVKKVDDTTKETENKSTKKSTTKSSTKKSSTTGTKLKTDEKSKTSDSNKSTETLNSKSTKTSKVPKKVSDKSTTSKNKKTTETKSKTTKTTKNSTSSKSKTTSTKKTPSTRIRKSTKKEDVLTSLEYYDLPYRYNQTIVKILAQTPNTLFIYWDISDEDRKNLEQTYGNEFFSNTKPVLIVHNETKNYSFEININDFANSWYLNISDTDCKYNIELGRRFINNTIISNDNNQTIYNNLNDYIYISSSNELVTPNDHILLSDFKNNTNIQFKNVKTNNYYTKKINIKPILHLYEELYSKEVLEDLPFNNPSSSNFIN